MKTHCKHGHLYTPTNTVWDTRAKGKRYRKCKTCARTRHKVGSRLNEKNKRRAQSDARKAAILQAIIQPYVDAINCLLAICPWRDRTGKEFNAVTMARKLVPIAAEEKVG